MNPEKKVVMDTTWSIGRQAANSIFYESLQVTTMHTCLSYHRWLVDKVPFPG